MGLLAVGLALAGCAAAPAPTGSPVQEVPGAFVVGEVWARSDAPREAWPLASGVEVRAARVELCRVEDQPGILDRCTWLGTDGGGEVHAALAPGTWRVRRIVLGMPSAGRYAPSTELTAWLDGEIHSDGLSTTGAPSREIAFARLDAAEVGAGAVLDLGRVSLILIPEDRRDAVPCSFGAPVPTVGAAESFTGVAAVLCHTPLGEAVARERVPEAAAWVPVLLAAPPAPVP